MKTVNNTINTKDKYFSKETEKQNQNIDNDDILQKQQIQFNRLVEQELHPNTFNTISEFNVNKYLPKDDVYTSSKIMRKYKNYLNKKNGNNQNEDKNKNVFQHNSLSEFVTESLFDEYSRIEEINFKLTEINDLNLKNKDNISSNVIEESPKKNVLNIKEIKNDNIIQYHNDNNFFTVFFKSLPYEENFYNNNINEIKNGECTKQNEIQEFNMKLLSNKDNMEINMDNNYQWYCLDYPIGNEDKDLIDQFLSYKI
jgi:hypothetical protein